jgi:subtilase family serine protease
VKRWRSFGATLAAGTVVAGLTLATSPAAAAATPHTRPACPTSKSPQTAACMILIRTDVKQRRESFFHGKAPVGFGYGPADLVAAYKLGRSKAVRKIAVVDAFNDPNAVSDLATYRSAWRLPKCIKLTGAGCLTVTTQLGSTKKLPKNAGSTGWATEESADIDMISAICPTCHIFLVEANSPKIDDLGIALDSAVKRLGASFVSNSYGTSESQAELGFDTRFYKHAGVAVTAAAGDNGFGVSYPAASEWVTAVGGTTLKKGGGGKRGWTETVWGNKAGGANSGTGSGCSEFEPAPPAQTSKPLAPKTCTRRIDNDVAAVADPRTGVGSYDTYDQRGWLEVGGTGVSAPIIAAVYALAGVPARGTFPNSYFYKHRQPGDLTQAAGGGLNDITQGADGTCTTDPLLCNAETGYDGPSGCGTPDGQSGFGPPASQIRRRPKMSGHPVCIT